MILVIVVCNALLRSNPTDCCCCRCCYHYYRLLLFIVIIFLCCFHFLRIAACPLLPAGADFSFRHAYRLTRKQETSSSHGTIPMSPRPKSNTAPSITRQMDGKAGCVGLSTSSTIEESLNQCTSCQRYSERMIAYFGTLARLMLGCCATPAYRRFQLTTGPRFFAGYMYRVGAQFHDIELVLHGAFLGGASFVVIMNYYS